MNSLIKKPEILFLIIAFIFGLLIMFITPKFGVADEQAHYLRAKDISQGILYNNPKNTQNLHGASGYSPVMYAASGLGIAVTKNFNENIQFYAGRFFNLIVWILLITFAIHITPVFKWQFFLVSLFPMSIYQGMSLSADSFSNAFTFLFFAYLFKLIFENFSYKRDIPLLTLFSTIGAFCKGAIFPIFLVFLIPKKRYKYIIGAFLFILALAITIIWANNNHMATRYMVDPNLNKNFVLQHPIKHLCNIFYTIIHTFQGLYSHIIGRLGPLTINLGNIVYRLTGLVFLLSFIFVPTKINIKLSYRIFALILFSSYVISTFTLQYIVWTPADSLYIEGVQGRYFIAMLPLIFIIFSQNKIKTKFNEIFQLASVFYIILLLIYTCGILYKVSQNLPILFSS